MKLISTLFVFAAFAALAAAVRQHNSRIDIPRPAQIAQNPCGPIRGVALNAIAQYIKAQEPCGMTLNERKPTRYSGFTIALGSKTKVREQPQSQRKRIWQSAVGDRAQFNLGLLMVG